MANLRSIQRRGLTGLDHARAKRLRARRFTQRSFGLQHHALTTTEFSILMAGVPHQDASDASMPVLSAPNRDTLRQRPCHHFSARSATGSRRSEKPLQHIYLPPLKQQIQVFQTEGNGMSYHSLKLISISPA